MAEKGFGVKEINLIGASGTPTIESPNNLNLNAVNVAISTNATIGGTLAVTGNVSVGGTLTYEDVTSIDSVGIITARSEIRAGAGLTVVGVSTFNDDVHLGLHGSGNPKIHFDESGDLLWFKKATAGGSSTKIGLGGGTSYDHLQLQQTYTGGGQSEITAYNSNILISAISAEKNITIQSTNDITLANGVYPFIKGEENSSSDQSVTLYHGQTGSTPYANPKLVTANTGVVITGICTATSFSGSGASLTNLPVADSDIQVAYTVTANGSSAYRFAGNGVVSTADDPDLYLMRGQKYRFINNSGGSHPFQIREASGGTAYSTGVTNNGAASGNIDFAPTYDSPAQLVYQCTSHSGMVGNIYLRDAAGANANVGVTTFANKITVESSTNTVANFKGSGGAGFIQVTDADDGTLAFIGVDGGTFKLQTSGGSYSDKITVDASGSTDINVGSGEADIYSTGSGDQLSLRLLNSDTTSGNKIGIYFGPCNNVAGAYIKGVAEADFTSTANRDAGLELGTRLNGSFLAPLKISAAGYVTKPNQPMFSAKGTTDAISAASPLPFDSTDYNVGNHYSTSTYKFTCPVSGYYYITCHVVPTNFTTGNVELYVQNTAGSRFFLDRKVKTSNYSTNNFSVGGSRIIYAAANDTFCVEFNGISGSPTLEGSSHFGIMLMA